MIGSRGGDPGMGFSTRDGFYFTTFQITTEIVTNNDKGQEACILSTLIGDGRVIFALLCGTKLAPVKFK